MWSRRLLGLDPLPVPPHVFRLEAHQLAYGRVARHPKGFRFQEYVQKALPPDSFQPGPLGGPLKDPQVFRGVLEGLMEGISVPVREASLVIPDPWLRVTFSEMGDLPRAAGAREEVLRWKLRRLVPFRVDELRIRATEVPPLPGQTEPRRLLLGFALEGLLAQLEDAFASVGVGIGQIGSTSLTLAAGLEVAGGDDELLGLAVAHLEGYTLVFLRQGELVLERHKAFTGDIGEATRGDLVIRDLRLTRTFLEGQLPGTRLGRVILAFPPEVEGVWLGWLESGFERPAETLSPEHLPPLELSGPVVPWHEAAPFLGAASREAA